MLSEVAWPSGLRRWFKAPVSSGAWVRIPPLPAGFFFCLRFSQNYTMTYLHSFYTFEQGGYFLKKTVVLCRWGRETQNFGFIN